MGNWKPHTMKYLVILLLLMCAAELVSSSCKSRGTCKKSFTTEALKKKLLPLQYQVTQEGGTETPFSSVLLYEKRNGKYKCVVCDKDVFSSTDRYESGKGWPAFKKAISNAVDITPELSGGVSKDETSCGDCGAHLGYRNKEGFYDINSAALKFRAEKKKKKKPAI